MIFEALVPSFSICSASSYPARFHRCGRKQQTSEGWSGQGACLGWKRGMLHRLWRGGRDGDRSSCSERIQGGRSGVGSVGGCVVASSLAIAPSGGTSTALRRSTETNLELVESEFYRMGYIRHVRAYGVEFREGPDGMGVYSAKDVPVLERPRIIMEIPLELMVTIRKELPWMFFPDIVPWGHPMFDIINATDPEADWDIRLACLLLLALDQKDNFWQLYGDYLPAADENTSMILASEEELQELQDEELAEDIRTQQRRAEDAWKRFFPEDSILKIKRLAPEPSRFLWAMATVMSRSFTMAMTIGALAQDANMLIPYVDMMNHSFEPTCSYRWRKKDRMLEVVLNAGQTILKGDEMTLNYLPDKPNMDYMRLYGFSSAKNPADVLDFSGDWKIHRESFLSAFGIYGLPDEYYYREQEGQEPDPFVDGAVIAAARILPSWSDGDLPFLPSMERQAVKGLLEECKEMLNAFPTTLEEDERICESEAGGKSVRWKAAIRHRMDRKTFILKIMQALTIYVNRILY